ncbi:HD domain-containing protein [Psychrobacter sp. AOP22-C1-22]|uniref:HD domain-containing protein n=1 Tax=unclassified Psychrobacter TaxID=196806 RepID=UPI001CE43060|nr:MULTISPECIES: hypothetical protein [unclassified Psychrobacter]MDN5802296.1 hypothetical protein [Psychrobacter sp.]MDN5892062.1 hypothetical protein [Psychrobacter sp.]MDN5898229.1 hypothetical protein [Psychrobacter sp.]
MQINSTLSNDFARHLAAVNSDMTPAESSMLWQDIASRYNEPQRAYHSLQHIQQLFAQFEKIKQHLYEPNIIALALYYHDVIYDPTRLDNELKSAKYAVEALSKYIDDEKRQHIYKLIMMTASHQIDELADSNKSSDAAYLLDMDLSILGAPWVEYEKYAQAVRQEYAYVSDIKYRAGRASVLNSLLAHPTLYITDYYYERLETKARINIKREITLLRAS